MENVENNNKNVDINEAVVYEGTVLWFRGNFGFIQWEKDGVPQTDLFCYYSDIVAEGFRTLKKNQKVSFGLGLNHKSQLKAVNVQALK